MTDNYVDTTPVEPLLTIDDAARILQWHPITVERKARRGEIPHLMLSSRALRFKRADLEAWITSKARVVKS